MKANMKGMAKRALPAAIGGAVAGGIHAAIEKYAGGTLPDWLEPLAPGLVGVVLTGKEGAMSSAGCAMIGYSTGTLTKTKVTEALGDEVLAADLDELFGEEEEKN